MPSTISLKTWCSRASPGRHSLGAAGLKWVSGYPANPERGLPYISGLIVLNDPETGIPVAVMDCTWITAQRTGAATALAARFLARPGSRTVGILACGVQGRTNLFALSALFPIDRVLAYDVDPQAQARYVRDMSSTLGTDLVGVRSPREAVVESDIVVTSGPIRRHPAPTIDADWLPPGAFASAVDFDSYWTGRALRQFDVVATDHRAQFEYYRRAGYFTEAPGPHVTLEDLVDLVRSVQPLIKPIYPHSVEMSDEAQIVVVGSHIPGLFIRVKRPPVAGETVIGWDYQEPMDGGKGSNQAIAAAKLGGRVSFVGCVGQDSIGEEGARWMAEAGVDIIHLKRSTKKTSGIGFILLDERGVPAMVCSMGANEELNQDDIEAALTDLKSGKVC